MMTISNPSPITSSRSGHAFFNSSYKYAGLMLANNPRDLRSFNKPASSLNCAGSLYHGDVLVFPPIEPINTASLFLAISKASSVNGSP